MANRYVRFYQGESDSTVIGFSASCGDTTKNETVRTFLQERFYSFTEIPRSEAPPGSTSYAHLEVRPPLNESDVIALGKLCVSVIDPYHNSVYTLDNRLTLPGKPFGPGIPIANT